MGWGWNMLKKKIKSRKIEADNMTTVERGQKLEYTTFYAQSPWSFCVWEIPVSTKRVKENAFCCICLLNPLL